MPGSTSAASHPVPLPGLDWNGIGGRRGPTMTRHVRPPRRVPGAEVPEPLPLPFRPRARIDPTPEVRTACPGPASVGSRRENARFWILSDLLIDRNPGFRLPDPLPEFDVLLVAGGVAIGLDVALNWLARALDGRQGNRPVLMVAGSAELWSETPISPTAAPIWPMPFWRCSRSRTSVWQAPCGAHDRKRSASPARPRRARRTGASLQQPSRRAAFETAPLLRSRLLQCRIMVLGTGMPG